MCDLPAVLSSATSSAWQRFNRQKCAHLIHDLAAAAALPPHSAHFSLQLLNLAHRWYERQDNNIHIFDVLSPATTIHTFIKMNPAPTQDPQQHAHSLAVRSARGNRKTPCQMPDTTTVHNHHQTPPSDKTTHKSDKKTITCNLNVNKKKST